MPRYVYTIEKKIHQDRVLVDICGDGERAVQKLRRTFHDCIVARGAIKSINLGEPVYAQNPDTLQYVAVAEKKRVS